MPYCDGRPAPSKNLYSNGKLHRELTDLRGVAATTATPIGRRPAAVRTRTASPTVDPVVRMSSTTITAPRRPRAPPPQHGMRRSGCRPARPSRARTGRPSAARRSAPARRTPRRRSSTQQPRGSRVRARRRHRRRELACCGARSAPARGRSAHVDGASSTTEAASRCASWRGESEAALLLPGDERRPQHTGVDACRRRAARHRPAKRRAVSGSRPGLPRIGTDRHPTRSTQAERRSSAAGTARAEQQVGRRDASLPIDQASVRCAPTRMPTPDASCGRQRP